MAEHLVEVTRDVSVPFTRVCEIFLHDPDVIFGAASGQVGRGGWGATFWWTLEPAPGSTATLGLEQLAKGQPLSGRPLRWTARMKVISQATGRNSPFPTFSGALEARADATGSRLVLRGNYQPPLGRVGALGDDVIGHHVPRHGLASFLEAAARRLDADSRQRASSWASARPSVSVRA
jgi:hypothetical protein